MATKDDFEKLKKYITDEIQLAFPKLKVAAIPKYDQQGDDLIGIFVEADGIPYSFVITKGDSPILQRYVPDEEG